MRIALPPGAGLLVERIALIAQPEVQVPCSFVAQSPGQLHVSNARIAYEVQPAPPPQPPAGGLSPPTPPDATPGDPTTGCCDANGSASAQPAPGPPLPAPGLARMVAPTRVATTTAELPLTSIKGIGAVRQRRLAAAGITTIRDLAAATPEAIARVLSGPGITPELGQTLIELARSALAAADRGARR